MDGLTSHYITSHTSRHITSHLITSHHITSHHITLQYITVNYITLAYITVLSGDLIRIEQHRPWTVELEVEKSTPNHITLHYITLHHITSHYIHNITLHYFLSIDPIRTEQHRSWTVELEVESLLRHLDELILRVVVRVNFHTERRTCNHIHRVRPTQTVQIQEIDDTVKKITQ